MTTCCLGNVAAASFFGNDDFGGTPLFVLLAHVLLSGAPSSTETSYFDDDLWSRRSLWRPAVSIIQQQQLVSTMMSSAVTLFSGWRMRWYQRRRLLRLRQRFVLTATFCLGGLGGDLLLCQYSNGMLSWRLRMSSEATLVSSGYLFW